MGETLSRLARIATVAGVLLAVAACGPARRAPAPSRLSSVPASVPSASGSASMGSSASARAGLPRFSHLFVVVMENLGYRQALAVPALAALAARYARASAYYAVTHPSLPNYLALTSGSTWGVTSDCWSCFVPGPDLGSELTRAGISWDAYMEGLPSPCWLGPYWPLTDYAGKHDPFRYFTDLRTDPAACAHIVPLTELTRALAGRGPVPRFSWVTPNLCHDGHDCPPSQAAEWLVHFVAQVTASPAWRNGGVLLVTWDEGNGADDRGVGPSDQILPSGGGGHVLTLVIAPDVPAGTVVSIPYNHYSLLRTVEEALGLPLLGQAGAAGTHPLAAFWDQAPSSAAMS